VQVVWRKCFWDRLPCTRHPALVIAHDVALIYRKGCIQQVSLEGYRAPIALLPSGDQHLTEWLLPARLYSGAPEIAYVLLRNPCQPHTEGPPLQHEFYESMVG